MPFLPARLLVSMATLGTANLAFANEQPELELAPIYTDHMFLQRDRPTPVTGIANPGAEVSVELAGVGGIGIGQGRHERMIRLGMAGQLRHGKWSR